jgi:hypothetical protein
VVLPISDSSTWEPKAGGLQVWSQPGLKWQDPSLRRKKKKKKKEKKRIAKAKS